MDSNIKEVTLMDTEELQDILESSTRTRARSHYSSNDISKMISNSEKEFKNMVLKSEINIYKVELNDSIVGFGGINLEYNVINCLYVRPQHADNGIGSLILRKLEKDSKKNNTNGVIVFSSLNATSFYRKNGYNKVHKIKENCGIISEDIEHIMMIKEFGSEDLIIDNVILSKLDFDIDKL